MKFCDKVAPVYDDLHSHILPGWDDGAENLTQALALARRATETGIHRIVTTPHVTFPPQSSRKAASAIPTAAKALQEAVSAEGLDLQIIPGAELILSWDLLTRLPEEPWLTFNGQGRYILGMVTAPGRLLPPFLEELIFRLLLLGTTPIICHPERLPVIHGKAELLREPVSRGARLQVTAGSLTRRAHPRIRACAHRLLRAGLVSLVASDVHGPDDVFPSQVAPELTRIVGPEAAHQILVDNPARVLAGEEIPAPAPTERRGIFSLLERLIRVGKRSPANNADPMEAVR